MNQIYYHSRRLSNVSGCLLPILAILASGSLSARTVHPLMEDWSFSLGEINALEIAPENDAQWIPVDLPHDWSITGLRQEDAPTAGGGGFFPSGTGWYRKTFDAPKHWLNQRILLVFEGVMQRATVWINGHELGTNLNGYLPFSHDLTEWIEPGAENTILVRSDTVEQPASRWYTGAGIYRPARLEVVDPVHVPEDGLFISAMDIYPVAATMDVRVPVLNTTDATVKTTVKAFLIDPKGIPLTQSTSTFTIGSGSTEVYNPRLTVPEPRLWSPGNPALYRLVAHIFVDGRLTDRREISFGIRSVSWSASKGLQLNGEALHLIGCNIHHDYGPLGAAVFKEAVYRKVRILKEAGFNAIRTAHNPPSRLLLQACDELGMLVINEAFDGWAKAKAKKDYHQYFPDNWQTDLARFIRRDRNHPSVIMWSIGNEMYERGDPKAVDLANAMRDLVKDLDPTRPVTAGINGLGQNRQWSELDPLFATLDVAGYNYELPRHLEDHERVPQRIIYASESYPVDVSRNHSIITGNSYVIGEFVWSGMDYLGEAGIGRCFATDEVVLPHWEGSHYPWHGATCGEIDLTGFRKPISHYRNILWDRGESLYLAVESKGPDGKPWQQSQWSVPPMEASWTWPGLEGQPLKVEVYSQHKLVRVFSGYNLVGEAEMSDKNGYRAVFEVPYEPGQITAQGLADDRVVETVTLATAGSPRSVSLEPDRSRAMADLSEIIFIEVAIKDARGTVHPRADLPIAYTVNGPATILAVGSGNLQSTESYLANPRKTWRGRALLVIRSTGEPGNVHIEAKANGLESGSAFVEFYKYPPR